MQVAVVTFPYLRVPHHVIGYQSAGNAGRGGRPILAAASAVGGASRSAAGCSGSGVVRWRELNHFGVHREVFAVDHLLGSNLQAVRYR